MIINSKMSDVIYCCMFLLVNKSDVKIRLKWRMFLGYKRLKCKFFMNENSWCVNGNIYENVVRCYLYF